MLEGEETTKRMGSKKYRIPTKLPTFFAGPLI